MDRLFLAIPLPAEIKTELLSLYTDFPGAKWEDDEKLHLSLRFIGETAPQAAADISSAMREISFMPFLIRVKGVGFFPPRGQVRIIWAGIEESPELISLQHKVENRLVRKTGFSPESRKYHPHVTMARCKQVNPELVGHFLMANSLFSTEEFTVDSFSLYKSTLSSSGSKYSIIESY